jgi:4-hydroxybenzoyl-CoA thioesterase
MPYPGPEPFSLRIPIRFTHCDPAGYVFFPRYFAMFQAVSEDWFTKCLDTRFADLIMRQEIGQPTAFVECQFLKPCVLGEYLDLAIVLEEFGASSLSMRYVGTVDGELRLTARSVQVLVSMKDGRPVPAPDYLREQFAAYRENVVPPDAPLPARRK